LPPRSGDAPFGDRHGCDPGFTTGLLAFSLLSIVVITLVVSLTSSPADAIDLRTRIADSITDGMFFHQGSDAPTEGDGHPRRNRSGERSGIVGSEAAVSEQVDGEGWRTRGRLFDCGSRDYQEGRPGYPDGVFRLLQKRCGLGPGSRVLEIGPGTGQATLPMLALGAQVTAVEPGAALARRLSEQAGSADLLVIVARFEDAAIPEAQFDLVVSATAFHWISPGVGLVKTAAALRDDGWLALWWNVFGDQGRPDPFLEALEPIVRRKAPEVFTEGGAMLTYALDVPARIAEIDSVDLYGPVHRQTLRWEGHHSPEEIRRLFSTFSTWLALPERQRAELLNDVEQLARGEFGGVVTRPYQTIVYLAQRRPR
jgi:SAM-dependent methyltransferase